MGREGSQMCRSTRGSEEAQQAKQEKCNNAVRLRADINNIVLLGNKGPAAISGADFIIRRCILNLWHSEMCL